MSLIVRPGATDCERYPRAGSGDKSATYGSHNLSALHGGNAIILVQWKEEYQAHRHADYQTLCQLLRLLGLPAWRFSSRAGNAHELALKIKNQLLTANGCAGICRISLQLHNLDVSEFS